MAPNLPERFNLKGKVALITGGAGLLGGEHAMALAECGATVVLTDINQTTIFERIIGLQKDLPGAKFVPVVMDVTDPASIRKALEVVQEREGRAPDILVNNAAIDPKVNPDQTDTRELTRFENFPVEQWDFQLDVGLKGAYLTSQIFGAEMARAGAGVILNIASDLSVIAPDQRLYRREGLADDQQPVKPVTYSVIKTALVGLTKYLASYWADRGVRVNALSPGGVYAGQPDEFVEKLAALIPMGRMAAREEYRGTVQYLCSDAAAYLTGQNIVVDGGRSVL